MAGGIANFSVTASGLRPLSYQWNFNGTNILGATNPTLTLTNVQVSQAGSYAVLVTNAYGSVLSSNAVLAVIPPASCAPAPSGLVSWWPAEGNANDVAGTNNGTPQNTTYTNGEVRQAFVFNGSSSLIMVPASSSLNVGLGSGFTIEAWVNPAGATLNNLQSLMEWNVGSGSGIGAQLGMSGGFDGDLYANIMDTTRTAHSLSSAAGIMVGNTFQHVAVTFDKITGLAVLYRNGVVVQSANLGTGFTPWTSVNFYIGCRPAGAFANHFKGIIDEPTLFNRALTASEIQAIYAAGAGGKCPPFAALPAITTQPTNQTVTVGGTATFSVTASGSLPLGYQWNFNGTNMQGATNTTLTLTNVQVSQAGNYAVLVTNAYGWAISSNAVLTVMAPPSIISQPANCTNVVGTTAGFSVTASGTAPLCYQWAFNETNMVGATNSTLTLTNVQLAQAGSYAVLVTNAYGSVLSSSAVLTVIPAGSCTPAPSGLVSWWPGEGNANDIAGPNNGTLVNGAGFAAGEVGQAFSFDGTGYVSIPDSPSLNAFVSSITIETWLKVNQLTVNSNWTGIVTKGNSSWRLHGAAGAETVVFSATGVSPRGDLYGSRNVNDGQWHHVAGIYDGTNMFLYVDGTLDVSQPATGSISQNNYPVCIGGNAQMTEYLFNGLIDEASIYSRALTASEIRAIYAAGPGGKCYVPTPPAINIQPADQTVNVGFTAYFSVTATGSLPLSYQWSFGRTNIAGATNTSLTLTNVQLSQAGNYAVLVTNAYGSVLSSNAVLTVTSPPGVPVITGFSPISGIIGTNVTIFGTDFSPVISSNIVYFGAVQAAVTAASATNLVVTMPAGATYAPITVTVNGLTAYSSTAFSPTFIGAGNNIGSGSFAPQVTINNPSSQVMTVADIDGDGKPDLIAANTYGSDISIFRNISTNGIIDNNSFAAPITIAVGSGPAQVAVGDLDGDGKLDLVAVNMNSGTASVFRNTSTPGSISFAPKFDLSTASDCRSVQVRDLDGDGKPDIIIASAGDHIVSVYRNLGTPGSLSAGSFASRMDFATPDQALTVVAGDLNGDGKPELVTGNYSLISIFRNISAPGSIAFAPRADTTMSSWGLAVGDLDGDGRPDLVVANPDNNTVTFLLNTTTSTTNIGFAAGVPFATGNYPYWAAIGDLNGDGKLDLVVSEASDNTVSVFQNTSTPGSFDTNSLAPREAFAVGSGPREVVLADLDGDGRLDIVAANLTDSYVSIRQNVMPFGGPPTITTQPADQTVYVGFTASFSVMATGSLPLSYQWSFDGTNIAEATNTVLTLTNVQFSQAGNYAVLVTNLFGSVLSSNAVLTVNPPPPCAPVPSGLISWWPGEGNADDVVGANNGTPQNITYIAGEVGQAFVFDGSSSLIVVPANPSLDVGLGGGFTLETWVNPAGDTLNELLLRRL